jgi:ornithine cyclodeaminase/alanine dehydrogenase-like protein (mu-crystallin family)
VTLFLSERNVAELLSPEDAVDAVEGSFRRMAAGAVELAPRRRLALDEGRLADMAASDLELGYAGVKAYAGFAEGTAFVVALFAADRPELVALIEADHLGRLRTGAASAVAAKYLAREGATSLGVIGCGTQGETQVACIRAAVPTIERVVAYCRTERNLRAFCERVGAEPAESNGEAAEQNVVVTITSGSAPAVWFAPPVRTSPPRVSSTTSCWSARRLSAATGKNRHESSLPT